MSSDFHSAREEKLPYSHFLGNEHIVVGLSQSILSHLLCYLLLDFGK